MDRVKTDSLLLRFQTALICEALIGKGNGARFVMDSWQLEDKVELSKDDIRKLLKEKKEKDALKRLKKQQNG
jgi:TfoX/Sxy family transcriptional regulator of competence genes